MTSGLTTVTATSALSIETLTRETPEMAETHEEKRLKRLWVRTEETMKRLRSTSAGRRWLVWVSGGRNLFTSNLVPTYYTYGWGEITDVGTVSFR